MKKNYEIKGNKHAIVVTLHDNSFSTFVELTGELASTYKDREILYVFSTEDNKIVFILDEK